MSVNADRGVILAANGRREQKADIGMWLGFHASYAALWADQVPFGQPSRQGGRPSFIEPLDSDTAEVFYKVEEAVDEMKIHAKRIARKSTDSY